MTHEYASPIKARLYKTAKTIDAIGSIPANTYVAVSLAYTDCLGRNIYSINTALASEEDVLEERLTSFCL